MKPIRYRTEYQTESSAKKMKQEKAENGAKEKESSATNSGASGNSSQVLKYKFGIGTLNSRGIQIQEAPPQSTSVGRPQTSVKTSVAVTPMTCGSGYPGVNQRGFWGHPAGAEMLPPYGFCCGTQCSPMQQAHGLLVSPSPSGSNTCNSLYFNSASHHGFRPCMQPMQQTPQAPAVPQRPPSPMFVSVPPRTQRLLHSEAYLRYIEGLHPDNPNISNWERQLTATKENTPLDKNSKLPTQWLANGSGHHENTVSALWALRDLMTKDALMISRTLEFSQL